MHPVASNFTVSDLIGITAAFLLFPLFTVVPGYVCGWLADALEFRRRTLLARFAISIPMSIGISPILAYLLWHWSIAAVWAVFGAMWIGFVGLMFHERRIWFSRPVVSGRRIAFLGIVAGWVLLGTFLLIDIQFQNRLYFPTFAYDYMLRAAITSSITRSGIPPHNPYFFPGHPIVLRYHYFWFILCSLVEQMGKGFISSRLAMLAGTLWSGIGLIAIVPLYLRFFQPKSADNLDRRMLIGVGLLAVTGLNVVVVACLDVLTRNVIVTNFEILAWMSAVLLAQHHVAALVACLTAFLLLWHRRDTQSLLSDVLTCAASGMMFASAVGLSVYVTLEFAAFSAMWIIVSCLRKRYREAGLLCAAGMVALALGVPYIWELLGGGSNQKASGGPLLQFAIRLFPLTYALISKSLPMGWPQTVANTLVLPLDYLIDLGFFAVVGFLQWRKMRASKSFLRHPELCGFVMAASALIVCTFLRSGVIAYNDFGIRGTMAAQFVLLIWGAELLDEGLLARAGSRVGAHPGLAGLGRDGKNLLIAMLALGVAGTLNDLYVLRSLPIVMDATSIPRTSWLSLDHNLGSRTYALRQLYENLKNKLPQDAVVQQNPNTSPGDTFYGLYADRQAAAETLGCGTVLGGDPAACAQIVGPIDDLFEKPRGIDVAQVGRVCKSLSIDAFIVKDTDLVWNDKASWVWQAQPSLANGYGRAFLCGQINNARIGER